MWRFLFSCFCLFMFNLCTVQAQVNCRTPNRERGKCIRLSSCAVLYDAVLTKDPKVVKFLRESQCGFSEEPFVCCGSVAFFAPPPTSPRILDRRPYLLTSNQECGYEDVTSKVIGGKVTAPEEFPWTALLGYKNSSGFEQFSCGGTLINERYILTAAHCVKGESIRIAGPLHKVRLGEWNTETDPDCYGGGTVKVCSEKPQDFGIEEAIPHPDYVEEARDRYHDIALIRMDGNARFSKFVRPACVPHPSSEQIAVGDTLEVVGWGKTETGKSSPFKLKVQVPLVAETSCNEIFSRASVYIRSSQLCAGGEKNKDACHGDSGGPLLAQRNNQFYVVGVVSFGAVCGMEGVPGIYTRVSQYRDRIEGNLLP
ncbi:Trypsin [Oryctes borbonicus]|uniref:CLIP domain-containing serine protease n=1 Tax=Oryctes borbonicus TaxID=1629725 RepID=A0A0T6AZY2_9SCAR|nr:Trypsin [Oryctes borbonicus]